MENLILPRMLSADTETLKCVLSNEDSFFNAESTKMAETYDEFIIFVKLDILQFVRSVF